MNIIYKGGILVMKKIFNIFVIVLFIITLSIGFAGCVKKESKAEKSFSIQHELSRESDDYLEINLDLPVVSGFEAAAKLNEEISTSVAAAKSEVKDAADALKAEGSQAIAGLGSNFLYSKNGDIVSIWIMMNNYTGGAHGLYWLNTYTFNTKTNEIYTFDNLFKEGEDYTTVIRNKIISEIKKAPDYYFPGAVDTIASYSGEFPFFINGNKIIVYFGLYDISPYAVGIRYFEFDADEINYLLKPEIYEIIKDATPIKTDGTIFKF